MKTGTAPTFPRRFGRSVLVLLLVGLPGLVILLWSVMNSRQEARAEAISTTTAIAKILAHEQARIFESVRTLLNVLSQLQAVTEAGPPCPAVLARMASLDSSIANLTVVSAEGMILCSGAPALIGRRLTDPSWLARAVASHGFSVGNYMEGQLSGRPLVLTGLTVTTSAGDVRVLGAAVDVRGLTRIIRNVSLPEDATITVLDRSGRVLAHEPAQDSLIGKTFVTMPASYSEIEGTTAEVHGADGVERIYSFEPLRSAPGSGVTIAVGVPTATAYLGADRMLRGLFVAMAVTAVLALAVARGRIAAELQTEHRRRAERERFFQSVTERAFDAVIVAGHDGRITYASPAIERLSGYAPEEVVGRSLHDFAPPGDHGSAERLRSLLAQAGTVIRSSFVDRTGKRRHIEVTAAPMNEPTSGVVVNTRDITAAVNAEIALRQSRDELRSLARRTQTQVEEERRRIARDVHDDLGQHITALGLDLAWLRRHVHSAPATERLDEMEKVLVATAQSIRGIAQALHGGFVEGFSLTDSVAAYLDQFQRRSGIAIDAEIGTIRSDIDRQLATAVFRIVQEALTNVSRHSGASKVRVVLQEQFGRLHLEVHDDGVGLHPKRGSHALGILGMSERALALGGTLRVGGSKHGGVMVTATFPV